MSPIFSFSPRVQIFGRGILLVWLMLPGGSCLADESKGSPPNLVPLPRKMEPGEGSLPLASARILARTPDLIGLAKVLSEEIEVTRRLKLPVVDQAERPGDIVLELDSKLKGEGYRLAVDRQAVASGGNPGAVANATVSILQAISGKGNAAALPRMLIQDDSDNHYRGLMIDVARKYHSIGNLKQIVRMCRFYKIRYLQLHLTDDQAFMFPTKAFPKVLEKSQNGGNAYTVEELKDLVAYADARNVTLIPEFDIPGHSAALNRSDPDFWMIRGTKPYEHHASINFARDEVVEACATIIGEMCDVFKSSPYFHIGGDEADYALADQNEDFQKAFAKLGLGKRGQHELYRRFLVQMDAAVKKKGKKTIVWEGFGEDPGTKFPIPKDVIVMVYENRFYQPDKLVKDGYAIINASWTPLYVMGVLEGYTRKIHDWNVNRFGAYTKDFTKTTWRDIEPTPLLGGAQICSWERHEAVEIANLRLPLAAMSERVWSTGGDKDWEDFQKRLAASDAVLEQLVHTVHWETEGLADIEDRMFDAPFSITMKSEEPGTIRYTLDGKVPTTESPVFNSPVQISKPTFVRSALFDADGKQVGDLTEDYFRSKSEQK